jgi:hypothetical protein
MRLRPAHVLAPGGAGGRRGAGRPPSPHREKGRIEAAHRNGEGTVRHSARGDEAEWSSAELCGEQRRRGRGDARREEEDDGLTGGPVTAVTRGGRGGARGWAARPTAGPGGKGRKGREREWEWAGWAGFRPRPSCALVSLSFFSFEFKPRVQTQIKFCSKTLRSSPRFI